jgi:hypothetical protein
MLLAFLWNGVEREPRHSLGSAEGCRVAGWYMCGQRPGSGTKKSCFNGNFVTRVQWPGPCAPHSPEGPATTQQLLAQGPGSPSLCS